MKCKTCRYSLEGLPEHRCPECGNAFDPNNSNTYYLAAEDKHWRWRWWAVAGFCIYLLAFAFSHWLLSSLPNPAHGIQLMINSALTAFLIGPFAVGLISRLALVERRRRISNKGDDDEP